jgi:hypothetical protein
MQNYTITFGCDPEFFFSKKGKVIGSEKVLPEDGMKSGEYQSHTGVGDGKGRIVIDGVQAELNPRPDTCRANLANEISSCFRELVKKMKELDVTADFSRAVNISDEEMASLSEKSKTFGCSVSYNSNRGGKASVITVDPHVYRVRAAGGHLHFGGGPNAGANDPILKVLKQPQRTVPMLDVVLGNTCVLIDRDPANAERRKVYGKAGEFRKPKHGLEYRTLSNFWLKDYKLMSFVTGLGRQAILLVANSAEGDEHSWESKIRAAVDIKDVERAINTNDVELARANFEKIKPILLEAFKYGDSYPITADKIDAFEHFIKKGVDYWFTGDIVEHWARLPEGHGTGFENFLTYTVGDDMKK